MILHLTSTNGTPLYCNLAHIIRMESRDYGTLITMTDCALTVKEPIYNILARILKGGQS